MSPNLPHDDVWTLTFELSEFTPAEAERASGLSTVMQRDWRGRGFLPKHARHARFTVFDLAEMYVMRMYADQGKGPSVSAPVASRVAVAMVKAALCWRPAVWGDFDPPSIFDRLPSDSRALTAWELADRERPDLRQDRTISDEEKTEWVVDALLRGLNVRHRVPASADAIWWADGSVEIGQFNSDNHRIIDDGPLDRIDPKFDGPALVLDLAACAANLSRRVDKPFLSADLSLNPAGVVNRPDLGTDHGRILVRRAGKKQNAPVSLRSVDDEAA